MRAAWLLVLAACQQAHVVTLQLGPSEDTLSVGFVCREDPLPGMPSMMTPLLAGRGIQPDGSLKFSMIVDVITLGGVLPGCRGEELFSGCQDSGDCEIVPRADGTRFCVEVEVSRQALTAAMGNTPDLAPMLEEIRARLDDEPVTLDAPDEPVMIRAVATTEACVPDTFDFEQLIGCAYSCPAQLDEVDGPIALSLDAINDRCEFEVKACASFPP
jgi:hypothetical protein